MRLAALEGGRCKSGAAVLSVFSSPFFGEVPPPLWGGGSRRAGHSELIPVPSRSEAVGDACHIVFACFRTHLSPCQFREGEFPREESGVRLFWKCGPRGCHLHGTHSLYHLPWGGISCSPCSLPPLPQSWGQWPRSTVA